jgi:hypothetical protein
MRPPIRTDPEIHRPTNGSVREVRRCRRETALRTRAAVQGQRLLHHRLRPQGERDESQKRTGFQIGETRRACIDRHRHGPGQGVRIVGNIWIFRFGRLLIDLSPRTRLKTVKPSIVGTRACLQAGRPLTGKTRWGLPLTLSAFGGSVTGRTHGLARGHLLRLLHQTANRH